MDKSFHYKINENTIRSCKNTGILQQILKYKYCGKSLKKDTNKMYLQKKSVNFFTVLSDAGTNKGFSKKTLFQNALMNFKEKSRWKYCFIIVFPSANKTILKETKIYLLIKGHFQMKINSLSFIKSNKLLVEILLIK